MDKFVVLCTLLVQLVLAVVFSENLAVYSDGSRLNAFSGHLLLGQLSFWTSRITSSWENRSTERFWISLTVAWAFWITNIRTSWALQIPELHLWMSWVSRFRSSLLWNVVGSPDFGCPSCETSWGLQILVVPLVKRLRVTRISVLPFMKRRGSPEFRYSLLWNAVGHQMSGPVHPCVLPGCLRLRANILSGKTAWPVRCLQCGLKMNSNLPLLTFVRRWQTLLVWFKLKKGIRGYSSQRWSKSFEVWRENWVELLEVNPKSN